MKYDKFFELAKAKGIEEVELFVSTSYSLSFSLFHGEVDKYAVEDGSSYIARGVYNGKFGVAVSDVYNKEKAEYLVDSIIKNAGIIENDDPSILFKGSEKYKKINTFNPELSKISVDEKMKKLYELEKRIKELDERIVEIEAVEYSETASSITLINSHGLKLTQKTNYYVYAGVAVAKSGEQVKTGFDLMFDNDFSKVDIDALAKKVVAAAVTQLGGEPCVSNTYKAVLSPEVASSLLKAYISNANAEDVQKRSSLFLGKLGQKVASKKLTVSDTPLHKGVFVRWFDDEGVATYNKPIIKNGVLQTYLYNLTTAAKDGVQTTGNGYKAGGKIGIASTYLTIKHGKKSQEELFQLVGDGIYITDIAGLHAGLNAQSGNFSLQSSGFLIENGKKTTPVDLITIGGNLIDLFNDVIEVGGDVKHLVGGVSIPSLVIKSIKVSGK